MYIAPLGMPPRTSASGCAGLHPTRVPAAGVLRTCLSARGPLVPRGPFHPSCKASIRLVACALEAHEKILSMMIMNFVMTVVQHNFLYFLTANIIPHLPTTTVILGG